MAPLLLPLFVLTSHASAADAPGAEPPKVAVIVLGNDASGAGNLQRSLETRLVALPQLRLRTSDQMVTLLYPSGERTDLAASDPVGLRAQELLNRIGRAFYEDRLEDAKADLAALDASGKVAPLTYAAAVRSQLWRAAIAQASKDTAGATTAVKAALALAPDLELDLRVYPPSLGDLLTSLRPTTGRSATLTVNAPPGAAVRVDDRLIDARTAVTPGRHRVVVSGRGYRLVDVSVEASGDSTLTVGLPLVLPADAERALSSFASGAGGGVDGSLAEIAKKLEVDGLVVVLRRIAGRDVLARTWSRTLPPEASPAYPETAAGLAQLNDWLEARFKPRVASVEIRNWRVATRGGLAFGSRYRALAAKSGGGYDAVFMGGGPLLDVTMAPGPWRGDLTASFVTYGLGGGFKTTFDDGTQASVGGGTTTAVRVAGGRAFGAGPTGREVRLELVPLAVFSWERHAGDDFRDERGPLGFFPSYERIAAGGGARLGSPVGRLGKGPLRVELETTVSPIGTWSESRRANGRNPRLLPAFDGRASLRWEPGRWNVSLDALGSRREVRFSGEARAPVDPPLRDVRLRETFGTMSMSVGRAF